jgi:hypothetical protein
MTVLVPIALVATELNTGVRNLEQVHGDVIVRDEAGLRCLPSDLVRTLVADRDRKLAAMRAAQAQRRQAQLERSAALSQHRRVQSLAAQQHSSDVDLSGLSLSQAALATMAGHESLEEMERAGRRFDEMASGTMVYRKFRQEEGGE